MNRTTLRTSTKHRRCACGTHILPGDQYLEQVISPDHDDIGNTTWWRASECRACACRYDRWPIPERRGDAAMSPVDNSDRPVVLLHVRAPHTPTRPDRRG